MACHLLLRSQANGTGTSEGWTFTGRDEVQLRDLLATLDADLVDPPDRRWDYKMRRWLGSKDQRWDAAMILFPSDESEPFITFTVRPSAEAAWSSAGALRLAEVLP